MPQPRLLSEALPERADKGSIPRQGGAGQVVATHVGLEEDGAAEARLARRTIGRL
jgi:hypothetical protein